MKFVAVIVAIFAVASASKLPIEKTEEKLEDRRGLQWPLPDPHSEGDLMLHGSHFYDRVEELRKGKLDNDVEKMILSYGREFLRKAHKYLEATPDFKVPAVLCRDSRDLNSSRRWEIRIQPEQQPAGDNKEQEQAKDKQQVQGEQQPKPQNDAPAQETEAQENDAKPAQPKQAKPANDEKLAASNVTNENVTEVATKAGEHFDTYERQRVDWYRRMGENFARLLMKRYRKETLIAEETQYIERWLDDEAIHFGVMGIYCHEGENVKELVKKIANYVEEK